ncbi:MAG: sigma-70 family RNA polymerase sigma factor [Planctomycetes bacterium]|jgi:RNA polymerase sigma-70 factor (ECF subfamily)|nr:sigma-70 family RNA polymerase sigma factor [Planctomycetota bacterium]MBT6453692.1 sigma-70 family RNA polymerase sigma factor [Planctomycetota bacterium]MBT6540667.1 sigma-70 family RNA polymerase sigma factor [Planctomycetota bacterium]MBT6783561.1 sigma-70 family RNA polymerase sigma factor [Planctomycetota bacterium]MBT6967366.1 sigma-70 family RNA polymerase sigma factor [Planctomycetota bacterium]
MSDTMNMGNMDLFEEITLPHMDDVFRFAMGLSKNRAQAEDLVQETYIKAFKAFGGFRTNSNAKAWLFRICKNQFIDGYRQRARRPHHGGEVEELGVDPVRHSIAVFERQGIENPETFLDLFGDEVNRHLRELPEVYSRALLMCDVNGLSYEEISEILDVPIGTIRSRISRGRAFLKERLEDYAEELGYGRK